MNKLFKKTCGFLCVGLTFLFVQNVKAATPNLYEFEFSNNESVKDGVISTNVTIWDSLGQGIMGDVNGNGVVELIDAQNVLKYSLGIIVDGISNAENLTNFKRLADMDGNGEILKNDAQKILNVALKIDSAQHATWQQSLSADEIDSLNYVIVNGDSNLYSAFEEYYKFTDDATTDTSDNVLIEKRDKLLQALASASLSSSTDKKTISGSLGTNKVDNIYLYVVVTIKNGTEVVKTYNFARYDVSAASNWEFLNNATDDNNNETTKEETKNEQTSKEETKVDVETETEIKTETKVETKKETKTEAKEETVENPETGITVSLIGSIITVIAGVVVKKKNIFSRI